MFNTLFVCRTLQRAFSEILVRRLPYRGFDAILTSRQTGLKYSVCMENLWPKVSRQFHFHHGNFNFHQANFNFTTAISISPRQFQFHHGNFNFIVGYLYPDGVHGPIESRRVFSVLRQVEKNCCDRIEIALMKNTGECTKFKTRLDTSWHSCIPPIFFLKILFS